MKIFHTVNAGLYLESGNKNILIDGIHRGADSGMSDMPAVLLHDLQNGTGIFRNIQNLLFTHLHPDHFDRDLITRFLEASSPEVYGPGLKENTVRPVSLGNGFDRITMNNMDVLAIRAPHEGKAFHDISNRSYLLFLEGTSVFVAGDSIFPPCLTDQFLARMNNQVDYAFFNPYQLICKESKTFLRQLQPRRLFLYHLPLPEDDTCNLYLLARNAVRNLDSGCPPARWISPMSWIDLS